MRPYCRSASSRPARRCVSATARWRPAQVVDHLVHAARQRARHVGAQDQQLGHLLGPDHVAIDLAVDLEAGDRAQHRRPVIEVDLRRPPPCALRVPKIARRSSAWNLTSSRRAVLSARSRKLPMRRKCKRLVLQHRADVTPRDRCERNLTHSKNALGLRSKLAGATMRWNSSQVWFCVSQTSVVSVPRTARAFSRAAIRQHVIDEPLSASLTMKSITSRGVDVAVALGEVAGQLADAEQAAPAAARPRRPTAAAATSGS